MILAGGAGTRLWPVSRAATPKHLLKLLQGRSLLRATYERAVAVAERVMVVTEAGQLEMARAELPELGKGDWLVEPGRRGTAGCLALAAGVLDPEGVMVSLHADHLVPDAAAFADTVGAALDWAAATDSLVTLGLRPRSPSTGFGYIEAGETLHADGRRDARRALGFVEKPPRAEAERMLASGDYLWNLGIFAWRNRVFLDQLAVTSPEIGSAAAAAVAAHLAGDEAGFRRLYLEVPEMAVDHAVMEKTRELLVIPADFTWSDVGSWADLRDAMAVDAAGNAVEGDAILLDSHDSTVMSLGGADRLVALVGVRGLVVVDTPDALLVIPEDRVQEVKELVAELRRRGRDQLL